MKRNRLKLFCTQRRSSVAVKVNRLPYNRLAYRGEPYPNVGVTEDAVDHIYLSTAEPRTIPSVEKAIVVLIGLSGGKAGTFD